MLKSDKEKKEFYEKTIKSYDAVAEQFSAKHAKDSRIEELVEKFINKFKDKPTILDAGCGPGRDINFFNKYNVNIIGIDISKSMVKEAQKNTDNRIYLMDIRDIDFNNNSFQGVWANASLHHLDEIDLEISFSEFYRVLKIHGYLFIAVKRGHKEFLDYEYPNNPRYFRKYWKTELYEIAEKTGFTPVWSNFSTNEKKKYTWIEIVFKKPPEQTSILTEECRFCDVLMTENKKEQEIYNKIIFDSDNFIVVNALGQLLLGYFLIVSKKHQPCFGAMKYKDLTELEEMKNTIRNQFTSIFGDYCFFEHGSSPNFNKAGSSIVHAHLHAVPAPDDFFDDVRSRFKPTKAINITSTIETFNEHKAYLYLEDKKNISEIYIINDNLPSQFLRRILSRYVDKHGQWDWKKYPHIQNIIKTMRLINKHRS